MAISALLFDKDGTLFDFTASWADWTDRVIEDLAGGAADRADALARALGFDRSTGRFSPGSVSIAGTVAEQSALLAPLLPQMTQRDLRRYLTEAAVEAEMRPAAPLGPLLDGLRARGLTLGVATNDAERAARAHLADAEITDRFAFVAGYDSGFGAKPAPGMCLAFAEAVEVPPSRVAMIGDSLHDLTAGRAAGMATVGVLTGTADRATLAPHADCVLDSIADLPDWLDGLDQAPKAMDEGPKATSSVAI